MTEPVPTKPAIAAGPEPIFRLIEYAVAERKFIGDTVEALARASDPLLSRLRVEPTSRVRTTQITTDAGDVVEQEPIEIRTKFTQSPQHIIDGRLDELLASLVVAAAEYAEALGRQFYEYLSRVSEATGNVVNAKDRPFFDSVYEIYEKVELHFDDEGRITQELHINPADVQKWQESWNEFTPEQLALLNELIERKRQEFYARRRHRRVPKRGN